MPSRLPLRFSVLSANKDEARQLIQAAGISISGEENGNDGLTTFVFEVEASDVPRVVNALPQELNAKRGIIGGVLPDFG